jgi:hypothetical protein
MDYMNGRPKSNFKKYTCSYIKKKWQINQINSQLLSIRYRLNISFPFPLSTYVPLRLSLDSYTTFKPLVRGFSALPWLSQARNVESGFTSSCPTLSMINFYE